MLRANDVGSSVAPAFLGAFFDRVSRDASKATGAETSALRQIASQCLADMTNLVGPADLVASVATAPSIHLQVEVHWREEKDISRDLSMCN